MNVLRGWMICGWKAVRFALYRLGVAKPPVLTDFFPEMLTFLGHLGNWPERFRMRFPERCPQHGPAVFVGNHLRADDPQMVFNAIVEATAGKGRMHYMMRHDFFKGVPFSEALGLNELVVRMGAYLIDRDHVTLAQLKPFITLLREEKCFGMFPGGTRSRTGQFFEYRDGITEPGGVSFFVAQAQRSKPEPPIPVVPVIRTWNPTTLRSTFVFGEPVYLPANASREMQRQFDFDLADHMGSFVEVNAAHITATILYLRCLHGRTEDLTFDDVAARVRRVLGRLEGCLIETATQEDPEEQVHAALAGFESSGLLRRHGGTIELAVEAILAVPPVDKQYVRRNPIKYLVNQILHLWHVTRLIEVEAL